MSATQTIPAIEKHQLVRIRNFAVPRGASTEAIEKLLDVLLSEKATGRIMIHLSQGTPGSLSFEEKQLLNAS